MNDDDDDLRARFVDIREETNRRTPNFQSLLRRNRRARGVVSRAWIIASCALIFITTATLLIPRREAPKPNLEQATPAILAWKSPTDFLLDTPGQEILRTIPKIGAFPDALPITLQSNYSRETFT